METAAILKIIHVFLLASVKYVVIFPYALLIGLNRTEAVISVTVGGICGFYFFYYLSTAIIQGLKSLQIRFIRIKIAFFPSAMASPSLKSRKIFSRKRRFLIRLRIRYGLPGIIISTPVLLSIPLGAFLLNKYYRKRKNVMIYMVLSIIGWAMLFSTVIIILPKPF